MRARFNLLALYRRRSAKFALALLLATVVIMLVTFTARAWRNKSGSSARLNTAAQPTIARGRLQNRLALQPEADKQRRRLGQRFLAPGREVSVLVGALTLGSERYTARITRKQDDDDERLTIALNDGGPSLTWSGMNGALSDGSAATGDRRSLIERIALYSPDQFILAQLRGSRYFPVAKAVRPAEIGAAADYTGPVWDVIRVDEPTGNGPNKPLALWRFYYINLKTGLIDKVVSQEQGQLITAEISGWVDQGGELSPTRILWTQNKQPIMELTFTGISHAPKQ